MSYTIPEFVDTPEQAILAVASAVKGEQVTGGDGNVGTALDLLADALAGENVEVPMTQQGAILALAQYVDGMVKPEGTITIDENGEGIDVAQYATADVSVSGGGGGDYTTATVTFANSSGDGIDAFAPAVDSDEAVGKIYISADGGNMEFILYKGSAYLSFANELSESSISVTGDLELDVESPDVYGIYITGDGTVTIS